MNDPQRAWWVELRRIQATYPPRPSLAELWGEDDPERVYAEAWAKGGRFYDRVMTRRLRREAAYDAPFRAAEEVAQRAFYAAWVEREREDHNAAMRDWRAAKKAQKETTP